MVRDLLADELAAGTVDAFGVWEGDDLCAVAAWRIEAVAGSKRCHCIVLAVRPGRRRRGHGRVLKEAVVAEATRVGADVVYSVVDFENDAMIGLNAALGANVERVPGDPDHLLCIIPVGRRRRPQRS